MEVIQINGQVRSEIGKRYVRALRKQGNIPCEMYGGDKNIHFWVDPHDVHSLIYSSDFKLAEVSVNGETHRCLVKEVQFHPVTDDVLHIDFQELVEKGKVNIEIPVRFEGVSPGIKNGGQLIQKVRKVSVRTTPDKIVNEIVLDISSVELGQSVRVRDIEAREGFEILNKPGIPLASVEVPRALKSATPEEEAEAALAIEGEEGEAKGEEEDKERPADSED
jgi:large subunit ribosomal protein L25